MKEINYKQAVQDVKSYFKWRLKRVKPCVDLMSEYASLKGKRVLDLGGGEAWNSTLMMQEKDCISLRIPKKRYKRK